MAEARQTAAVDVDKIKPESSGSRGEALRGYRHSRFARFLGDPAFQEEVLLSSDLVWTCSKCLFRVHMLSLQNKAPS